MTPSLSQSPRPAGIGASAAAIESEILSLLLRGLPRGLVLTVVNAGLLAFLLRDQAPQSMLVGWLAAMIVVSAARLALVVAHARRPEALTTSDWRRLFFAGAVLGGGAWGASALMLMPENSLGHQMLIGFVLAGMAAGAMASLAFDRLVYPAYVVAAIGPYSLAILATGGETQMVMGVLSLLFIAAMSVGGRTFSTSIVETLKLKFEKDALVADLALKAQIEADANKRLQVEIERAAVAEAQMRRAKEEEAAANRAKSQFLANMSHEIRTPMNGVLGMAELLMRSNLDDRQRRLTDTLCSSGKMLLSLIDDILDLSRIEAGKLQLTRERFNLRDCFTDAIQIFSEQARQKGLVLQTEFAEGLPAYVEGDPLRLRQVCVNLVGNAIKFTSTGSVVVRLTCEPARNGTFEVTFVVIDTGIGIDKSARARILQPFEQADASTSRRYGGTGLGLAICANLIGLMGGTFDIDGTPGQGTTATCRFRLAVAPLASDCEVRMTAAHQNGIRVLVAEDNPVNQEIAREFLAELGCVVEIVDNGQAAVEAFEQRRFEIVLMDCQMPELDGLEATVRVRQLEAAESRTHTPIVALTASAFDEDRERCIRAGMDDHLAKPYSPDELAELLDRWVPRTKAA